MQNKIEDLRNHLFATIESLRDEDKPMDLERAKTIASVAQTIINSAKAETDFLSTIGERQGSGFMPQSDTPRVSTAPRLATSRKV